MEAEKLKYIWKATFKDGSVINQFDSEDQKSGEDIHYKEVLEKQNDLVTFSLIHVETKLTFIVNFIHGFISLTHLSVPPIELNNDEEHKREYEYRPIYFRKMSAELNPHLSIEENNEQKIKCLWYTFGFQYLDENGKNHKRLVKLFNDGRYTIY